MAFSDSSSNSPAPVPGQAFIDAILNTIDSLVLATDREGRIIAFNRACERASGYTFAEVRGQTGEMLVPPEQIAPAKEVFDELLKSKQPNSSENDWITRDGRRRRIVWNNTVLLNEAGEVEYVVGTGVDVTERRQAEALLRESEDRYDSLFNNQRTPMMLIEPATGRIVSANPAACAFYGWDRSTLESMSITQINLLPSGRALQELENARTAPSIRQFTFKHRLASGELRDVEIHSSPVRIGDSQYLFSIIHDITDRTRIEAEMRSISRFPQEDPNPILRFTLDGQLLYANKASRRLLDCWQVRPGDRAPLDITTLVRQLAASRDEKGEEIELQCGNSTYLMQFLYIAGEQYVNAYGKDITIRKRLAEENIRQRSILDLVFQFDPGGLAVISGADFTFRFANPAYRALTPNPAIDPVGQHYVDVWPNHEEFQGITLFQQVLESGQPVHSIAHQRPYPDGSVHYFSFHVTRQDWEGEPALFIVLWDTTDLYLAKQTAEAAAAEAERRAHEAEENRRIQEELTNEVQRANRELQDFAYIASHDLQEPLRKIQAFGDRLQNRYGNALGEEGADYVARMVSAANRMGAMLRGLLDYSRVTTAAQPYSLVDLETIVQGVLSDLEIRIEQTGGQVEVGSLPIVQADTTQMRLLLQNLIGNALKFHRPGQAPRIKVSGRRIPPLNSQRAQVEITVADNGIGFDVRYLERILQPFQRLHGRGQFEGHGMGLAICRKIVERHGGTITARSETGKGAEFIVTLPERRE